MKKLLLTGIIYICFSNIVNSQLLIEPSLIQLSSSDYGLNKEIEELHLQQATDKSLTNREIFIQQYIRKMKTERGSTSSLPDTSCVITIPVVFHVFHPQGGAGVTMSQIDYAMNDLNLNYAGSDADYITVDPLFASIKSYTKIRFAKALIDPDGNPTTGVVYYKDKQSGFGNGTGYDNEIVSCAWDNFKYFNIYVMNDLYNDNITNNSGVCWYPSISMSNNGTARMVYNYSYLGFGGSSFNNLEFNETFTHECGHYLDLIHTFDGNSCTGPGDYCNDTPPTDISAAGCNAIKCGGSINGENYMDYNTTCYKNFTMDQNTRMEAALTDPSRQPLWQYDNLVATGILNPASTNSCVMANKFLSYSKTTVKEALANDGTIDTPPVIIYSCGGAQFASPGITMVAGTDYTITNVPVGLSVSLITSVSAQSVTMTFSGQATNHTAGNSVINVQLTFNNNAFVGGAATTILNYTKTFSILFNNPWQQICETPNITTSSSSTWNSFETIGSIPRYYGLWYNSGNYYLENYGRGIITTNALSNNIQFLASGTTIDAASTWKAGGSQGILYSSFYTALNNTIGYVGFRMQAGTDYFYGWMKISVSSTSGTTLLQYQYNEKPNDPIIVGAVCNSLGIPKENLIPNNVSIYPNPFDLSATISFAKEQRNTFVKIIDLLGKEIKTMQVNGKQIVIEKGEMKEGIYFVQIMDEKKNVINKKIVLQ